MTDIEQTLQYLEQSGYSSHIRAARLIRMEFAAETFSKKHHKRLDQQAATIRELRKAARAMVESYADHVDRCRVCTINWQSLKAALAKEKADD